MSSAEHPTERSRGASTRDLWQRFGIDAVKLLAWGFAFGLAYASVTNKLEAKADKTTVERMANDIRIVRILLCEKEGTDSFCRGAP